MLRLLSRLTGRVGGTSNRSLRHILRKSWEDYRALRANGMGGVSEVAALVWKNLSAVPQFWQGGKRCGRGRARRVVGFGGVLRSLAVRTGLEFWVGVGRWSGACILVGRDSRT